MEGKLLMTPGPTRVPDRVLRKMSEAVLHHRTIEYSKVFGELSERLKYVFQTDKTVLTFPAVGTGGLESAIVNMFSEGDRVLVVCTGVFGERFATIARNYRLKVDTIDVEWGKSVSLDQIEEKFDDNIYKGLIVTHNETSTAVLNPIEKIGEYMKDKNALFIVDSVSGLGGLDIKMDEWNIDVLITACQKALMSPPGLAFVGVSDKAWERAQESKIPKYYWDYINCRKYLEKVNPQNPYTPAVSLVSATNEALKMIQEEGLQNVFKRHEILATRLRKATNDMGLKIFTDSNSLSNNLTAFTFEEQGKAIEIKKRMEEEYNIVISGGQAHLNGKMIRIGHMGFVDQEMIDLTVNALKNCL
ncbi:alanine--glyoxylate aminotransferase family protein [Clostridium sediminicola]|uniref:pyridoxal-phosphate-dependent aminotransferase family protein n=1 Tax=Clostridium sediminicola TaxID=3114879 RepID=UPI0031F24E0F